MPGNRTLEDIGNALRGRVRCPICDHSSITQLKTPLARSMRSDGLVFQEPLRKVHCSGCGVLIGKNSTSTSAYQRSSGNSSFEIRRHQRIATGLSSLIRQLTGKIDLNVLEVGAGNFETALGLKKLNPRYKLTALEPNPESTPSSGRIEVSVEDFRNWEPRDKYDVCYSWHVIEHFDDAKRFIKLMKRVTKDDGFIVICCPDSNRATSELLFADHNYHFTAEAMSICAIKAGLEVVSHTVCAWEPTTKCYVLSKRLDSNLDTFPVVEEDYDDLKQERTRLYEKWGGEDLRICEALGGVEKVSLYGAGEFAQLLRAYLPHVWMKVQKLVVDDLTGVRTFDRPVLKFDEVKFDGRDNFLVAAHGESRSSMRTRLLDRGIPEQSIHVPFDYHSR